MYVWNVVINAGFLFIIGGKAMCYRSIQVQELFNVHSYWTVWSGHFGHELAWAGYLLPLGVLCVTLRGANINRTLISPLATVVLNSLLRIRLQQVGRIVPLQSKDLWRKIYIESVTNPLCNTVLRYFIALYHVLYKLNIFIIGFITI